jgi:hypothetical protein
MANENHPLDIYIDIICISCVPKQKLCWEDNQTTNPPGLNDFCNGIRNHETKN